MNKGLDYLMNNFEVWKVRVALGLLTLILILLLVFWDPSSPIWSFILGLSAGSTTGSFLMSFTYKTIEE